jgi:hypothetical protein
MYVNINFTLAVNPQEWAGRLTGTPVALDVNDPAVIDTINREVRNHVQETVREFFVDNGWVDA